MDTRHRKTLDEIRSDQIWSDHSEREKHERLINSVYQQVAADFQPDGHGTINDSVGGNTNIKSQYAGNFNSISERHLAWFLEHSFIGYSICGLLAQHWLIDLACSQKGRDAVSSGFELIEQSGKKLSPEELAWINKNSLKYDLNLHLRRADKFRNVHGIRHILFIIDGIDYEKPYNPDGIRPGAYTGIRQVDPYWIAPQLSTSGTSDPRDLQFYEPEYWQIRGEKIHRSHFILRGPEVEDVLKPTYRFGGIPLPQRIYRRVYNAERTANEAPELARTKRQFIHHVDLEKVAADPAKFFEQQQRSVDLSDNYGKFFIGLKENLSKLETSLSDFDSVIASQYQLVAAAAGYPVTKLMRTTPTGLSSTGEHEIRQYHEELQAIQTNDFSRIINRHFECLMRSAICPEFQCDPFELHHEWLPLSDITEEQRANIASVRATTAKSYWDIGAVDAYDVRDNLIRDRFSGYTGMESVERPDPLEDLENQDETENG